MHERKVLSLGQDVFRHRVVALRRTVERIQHQADACTAAPLLQDIGKTEVLGAHGGRQNVQVRQADLVAGDLVCGVGVVPDEVRQVAEGLDLLFQLILL